jgi:putative membrane fusion protein
MKQGTVFTKLVVPVVFLAIVAYLVLSAFVGLRDAYPVTVTYTDTMQETVVASGWVVRSEQPIQGGQGLVQLQRSQGEKVGKGQAIAVVYQDEAYVEHQEELVKTQSDLTALQYATYSGSPSGVSLEDQMLSSMMTLRQAASSGNYTNLSDQAETYRKLVLRREYLVSSDAAADMTASATVLYDKYVSLQSAQSGATTITAPVSGVFSSTMDGYETLLTPDLLEAMSPSDVAELANLTPLSNGDYLGKLITGTTWYYVVTVPGEYADSFTKDSTASVYFDSLSETLDMTIEQVSEVQEDQAVVVFSSTKSMSDAADLRQETCQVIFHSYTGLRIPKEALRVYEGETGVFIRSGYTARFRPVEIVAEDEDNYLVKANPTSEEDTRVLRAGDEIILASDELYNGKVVR